MRISTSLPDGNWREVAEAARAFEELGIDEAAAHEVRHDSFATLVPATLSTQDRTYNLRCDCFSAQSHDRGNPRSRLERELQRKICAWPW